MNKFNILTGIVGVIAAFTGYLFFTNQISSVINVGAELPDAPALFETSLAAPITATADSFTLTSNTVRGGGSISGYQCFTIDEGSAQAEFVCGTASSTSVTGVTRGISPSDGTTEVASLKFAHRRGASVKITDFPIIQILRNQNNGEATFENALRYAASVVPSSADELADVGYVLSVVNGGTVNFDALVVSGVAGETLSTSTLVYFATTTQRWFKVDTDDVNTFQERAVGFTRGSGTTGNSISNGGVLLKGLQTGLTGLTAGGTYYASSTAGALGTATSALPIGQAKSTTELQFDPVMMAVPRLGFNNTFTGSNTFNGTTTFNGGVLGAFRTKVTTYTASTTWVMSSTTKVVYVQVWGGGGSGGLTTSAGGEAGGGGGGGYAERWFNASSLGTTATVTIGMGGATVTSQASGNVGGNSSFGSVIAYGGGGGQGNTTGGAYGGGGGGILSAGGVNTQGEPISFTSNGGTSAGTSGSAAYLGAGGGGAANGGAAGNGGNSYNGGGGGGGAVEGTSTGTRGTSVFGGDGGNGNSSASGNAVGGSTPGGGGGGKAGAAGNSGAGGNGLVIVTEYY